ncbi:MAG: hypothetical protein KBF26_08380, partial [Opitutaceae bacterium]|nr:hypothetical protein [Opitutaceae bacterium]
MHKSPEAGFALILTLLLLGLLVLAVYALSALVRVDGQVASASAYQTQARQNALLGLDLGLTELQRQTGEDAIVTGMAGLTGIPPNAANTTRHWCGVWRQADGAFLAWLASGAQPSGGAAVQPGLDRLELVGSNTVGASAANSEHTIAGRMPIVVSEIHGAPGRATRVGSYAWLAVDEGVKTPADTPGPVPVTSPLIFSTSPTSAAGRLRDAIASYASNLPKALIY